MTTESQAETVPGANSADVDANVSLLTEITRLATMVARSPEHNRLLLAIAGLILVVAGTAYMQTLFIGLLSATLLRSGPVRHAQITSRNRSARRDLQAG